MADFALQWCKMAPIDLNLVRAALAVHDTGSFSRAAQRLMVPRSTVSRAVAALEDQLGIALFQRTTRRVTITSAGEALVERVRTHLTGLEGALRDLPEQQPAPSGTLRITTTPDLGAALLSEIVARFLARYPQVNVDVQLAGELVNLVEGGFDLALRVSRRRLRDSTQVARRVGPVVFQLYAAPSYLARAGTPRSAADLTAHERVSFRGLPLLTRRAEANRVLCDDMFFACAAVRAGAGIGALPSYLTPEDVANGKLVRVLPRWSQQVGTVHLVHPAQKHVPRRVTAFQELAMEALRNGPLGRPASD
jgi:DNA-binding transcriptional LysR family regulator